ncbi:hypothetical protein SSS_09552, partial [Sarcoptes scabiei]
MLIIHLSKKKKNSVSHIHTHNTHTEMNTNIYNLRVLFDVPSNSILIPHLIMVDDMVLIIIIIIIIISCYDGKLLSLSLSLSFYGLDNVLYPFTAIKFLTLSSVFKRMGVKKKKKENSK